MSGRSSVSRGTVDITDGALPAGVKAWGFAPSSGAAFTSCEIDNSGNDDKASKGWDATFSSPALRATEYGSAITGAVVTGTITFYIA